MKKNIKTILALVLTAVMLLAASCGSIHETTETAEPVPETTATTDTDTAVTETETETTTEPMIEHHYSVSSSNDYVTQVGLDILASGGNAVDAAVAMGYMLGVTEPYSNGLGGSGGMLVYDSAADKAVLIDYRATGGKDPAGLTGVPGFAAGMEKAAELYGTMPVKDLIAPAIERAEQGFTVNSTLSAQISSYSHITLEHGEYRNGDGYIISAGDTMYQPVLAETLKRIQENGAAEVYTGQTSKDIIEASALAAGDLSGYEAVIKDAIYADYRGFRVYSSDAPFSGLMLLQMLKMAEKQDMGDYNSDLPSYLERLELITNLAQEDRFNHTGDPAFTHTNSNDYLADSYIGDLLGTTAELVTDTEEKIETTSYSVCDGNGLTVSVTNTISDIFGCGTYVDGFWLNDTNTNFSANGINTYEAGKRSRTYTAPTIVTGANGFVMAIGTPGGSKIPGILFRVINNVLIQGMNYRSAVSTYRFLYANGSLYVENNMFGEAAIDADAFYGNSIYIEHGFTWGSVSLAGYSDREGAFAAYDTRRGATFAGMVNEIVPANTESGE